MEGESAQHYLIYSIYFGVLHRREKGILKIGNHSSKYSLSTVLSPREYNGSIVRDVLGIPLSLRCHSKLNTGRN